MVSYKKHKLKQYPNKGIATQGHNNPNISVSTWIGILLGTIIFLAAGLLICGVLFVTFFIKY